MGKNVVFLDENEIDNRIQTAVKNAKIGNGTKIYGVSGIGQENPILVRTHDAAGVDLVLTNNNGLIECVATDDTFQKFFDFPEHTDELGNVFLTITPKAFKFDRTSGGEVTAISVKEYEDGDEANGYMVHPFFKNWTSETTYDGIVSREIAKYLNAAYDIANDEVYEGDCGNVKDDIVVTSKPGLEFNLSFASWIDGREIIKNTSEKYGIMSWMFIDLFRYLFLIYFGRTDIHNFFEVDFEYDEDETGRFYYEYEQANVTGTTDSINSHTGFNTNSSHYKIFNIDHALAGISVDGCYQTIEGFYYSHLFDFDAFSDEGANISTITNKVTSYTEEYDIITKMGYDEREPAFKVALAARQATSDNPVDTRQNIYYSCKQKLGTIEEPGVRGQYIAFSWYSTMLYPDNGAFYSGWGFDFNDAWGDDGRAVRLCKSPF